MSPSTRPRFTLLTTHAHPDDESIGTGGVMAKAVADGHRVILVTCTRGEQGEIVVPEWDTPEGHRRLAETRAAELEAAMAELGVTEWENLGYRDSDMMGRVGNHDPRNFWTAPLDESARRLTWLIRRDRPDVVTTYDAFGGYGHPDHIRTHDVAVAAFARAGDPSWYPEQLAPEHGGSGPSAAEGGLAPWQPAKLYEQAFRRELREAIQQRLEAIGERPPWAPPEDATPEQLAEHEAYQRKLAAGEGDITTRVDISAHLDAKWRALLAHRTQMAPATNPFIRFGVDLWREVWASEAFVLRHAHVPVAPPEDDLFAGLTPGGAGPYGWGSAASMPAATGST